MKIMNHIYNKEFWDKVALNNPYDGILSGYDKKRFWKEKVGLPQELLDELDKGMIFLDLGCGIGRMAKWVSPLVKEYYGIDFSTRMIKKAKKIFKDNRKVHFSVNNGVDLELFEDNKFDVIYVCLLFQHMQKEHTLNYIKEIYRVLKKEGVFYANNIPREEMYVGGLKEDELDKVMKPFKILNKQISKYYFFIKCQKY